MPSKTMNGHIVQSMLSKDCEQQSCDNTYRRARVWRFSRRRTRYIWRWLHHGLGGISVMGPTEPFMIMNGNLTAVRYRYEIHHPIVRPYADAIDLFFIPLDDNARPDRRHYCRLPVNRNYRQDGLACEISRFESDRTCVGRPIAAICHGAWMFCSAKILQGKRATCFIAIKDDVENAGALYEDTSVVVDGNMITSRIPADLPNFCKAIIAKLKEAK